MNIAEILEKKAAEQMALRDEFVAAINAAIDDARTNRTQAVTTPPEKLYVPTIKTVVGEYQALGWVVRELEPAPGTHYPRYEFLDQAECARRVTAPVVRESDGSVGAGVGAHTIRKDA